MFHEEEVRAGRFCMIFKRRSRRGIELFEGCQQICVLTKKVDDKFEGSGRRIEHTFIQKRFHPLTLSSKHDFIQ